MANIFAHITCTRVKWEATVEEYAKMSQQTEEEVREEWSEDSDYDAASDTIRLEDPMEESGWIDRSWSRYVLHDSRNDVRSVFIVDEIDTETLTEEVRDVLEWLGAYEDNGDGTFYASENDDEPYDDPWRYSYAVHFTRKFFDWNGWTEESWIPPTDMLN